MCWLSSADMSRLTAASARGFGSFRCVQQEGQGSDDCRQTGCEEVSREEMGALHDYLPSFFCASFWALIAATPILDAPGGGSKLNRKSGSFPSKSQCENSAMNCGEFSSSLYVNTILRGTGRAPSSTHTCQSTEPSEKARCSHGVPSTVTGPISVPETIFF